MIAKFRGYIRYEGDDEEGEEDEEIINYILSIYHDIEKWAHTSGFDVIYDGPGADEDRYNIFALSDNGTKFTALYYDKKYITYTVTFYTVKGIMMDKEKIKELMNIVQNDVSKINEYLKNDAERSNKYVTFDFYYD